VPEILPDNGKSISASFPDPASAMILYTTSGDKDYRTFGQTPAIVWTDLPTVVKNFTSALLALLRIAS
jgi:hypothetical protein